MPEAKLKAKLTMHDSLFHKGLSKALSGAKAFAGRFSGVMRGIGRGLGSIWTGLAAVIGTKMFADGIKGAYDLGGQLVDLSTKTGFAVDKLVDFGQVAEEVGISMEALGQANARLQKKVAEAAQGSPEARKAFHALGMDLNDLARDAAYPARMFSIVGENIFRIKNKALQTKVAMDMFGKSGADLIPLFANLTEGTFDSGLFERASILRDSAKLFDEVSDNLNRAGKNIQNFFLGAAEQMAPTLLKVLKDFQNLPIANWGREVGKFLANGMEFLSDFFHRPGEYMTSWKNYLKGIVAEIGNSLVNGFIDAAEGLKSALEAPIGALLDLLTALQGAPVIGDKISDSMIKAAQAMQKALKPSSNPMLKKDWFGSENYMTKAQLGPRSVMSEEKREEPAPANRLFTNQTNRARFMGSSSLTSTGAGANSLQEKWLSDWQKKQAGWNPRAASMDTAFGQTSLLSLKERRDFEDKAAADGGTRTGTSKGAFNVVRSGDKKRREEVEKERLRGKLGIDRTNDILERIDGYMQPVFQGQS